MLLFSLVLSLIALFTSPAAAEQSSACSLLTSSDIEVVTGGKMGVTQPIHFDDVPAGPNRSMKVLGCLLYCSLPSRAKSPSAGSQAPSLMKTSPN